jgi:hypothetical protein
MKEGKGYRVRKREGKEKEEERGEEIKLDRAVKEE